MSVAVCRSSVASGFESILALPAALSASSNCLHSSPVAPKNPQTQTEAERSPGEVDMWASIQDQKAQQEPVKKEEPYVHPLMRRSSSLLSKKSLEICTENLGSESGSDDYFSFSDDESNFFTNNKQTAVEEEELAHKEKRMRSNYRCCSMSRASELRRFPPPLPSISRRDGPCLKMRPLRRDGRLVVEAVTVPSQNYLQAQRHNGRLLLSFINTTTTTTTSHNSSSDDAIERNNATGGIINEEEAQYDTEEEEEEEEEEVQVVDRGTVVEVNVSTKPPQQNKKKVRRSSIVINKFVSFTPTINNEDNYATPAAARPSARRSSTTATTAAAAAVAASSLSASSAGDVADLSATAESKLMLTRRRNGGELLLDMRRCGQLRRPLFFREACCIATSS